MARMALLSVSALLAAALAASAAPAAATAPVRVVITVAGGKVLGGPRRPTISRGRTIRFVIRTDRGESVHLHGYEINRKVIRGRTTVIQFVAKLRGRFELELHHPDVLLADLTVR